MLEDCSDFIANALELLQPCTNQVIDINLSILSVFQSVFMHDIDGLLQERHSSIADMLELCLFFY